MQPFERLRYIARHDGDDRTMVAEAADCLAAFDDDLAGLVVACRRLIDHHTDSPLLWWLCARVLAAPDPADAAWEAEGLVRDDHTPGRLAGLLPFPHDDPIAVLGWPELAGEAFESRPDLDVLAVRGVGNDGWARRLAHSDAIGASGRPGRGHGVRTVARAGRGDRRVARRRRSVPHGTGALLDELTKPTTIVWLVAGVGRVLPGSALRRDARRASSRSRITGSSCSTSRSPTASPGPTGLVRPDQLDAARRRARPAGAAAAAI